MITSDTYKKTQTSQNDLSLTEPVDNPQGKKLIEYHEACDKLGVGHQTKIYRPPALDFPRSANYVTTAKAYEKVLLPAILTRINSGMSQKDAVLDVFATADAGNNFVVSYAEAKVFSHVDKYN